MIQCPDCPREFETHEELWEHRRLYQTEIQSEITRFISRLQALAAHDYDASRSRHLISTDLEDNGRQNTPGLARGSFALTGWVDQLSPARQEARARLRCPHSDCDRAEEQTFSRLQDLVRHYSYHYECQEFCPYCSVTFTRAKPYLKHSCVNDGPTDQRAHTKQRCRALRRDIRNELNSKASKQAINHRGPRTRRVSNTMPPSDWNPTTSPPASCTSPTPLALDNSSPTEQEQSVSALQTIISSAFVNSSSTDAQQARDMSSYQLAHAPIYSQALPNSMEQELPITAHPRLCAPIYYPHQQRQSAPAQEPVHAPIYSGGSSNIAEQEQSGLSMFYPPSSF